MDCVYRDRRTKRKSWVIAYIGPDRGAHHLCPDMSQKNILVTADSFFARLQGWSRS